MTGNLAVFVILVTYRWADEYAFKPYKWGDEYAFKSLQPGMKYSNCIVSGIKAVVLTELIERTQ